MELNLCILVLPLIIAADVVVIQTASNRRETGVSADRCQGVLTLLCKSEHMITCNQERSGARRVCAAAYCSSSNVELPFSASAIYLAPSASIAFQSILQEGVKHKKRRRQGALTLWCKSEHMHREERMRQRTSASTTWNWP